MSDAISDAFKEVEEVDHDKTSADWLRKNFFTYQVFIETVDRLRDKGYTVETTGNSIRIFKEI